MRRAAIGGLVATFVALTVGFWLPGLGLPRLDYPLLNGNLLVPESTSVSFGWLLGLAHTLGLGALLAVVYSVWVRDRLPGAAWLRGLIWGALVVAVGGLTVFPLLYGAGVFARNWHPTAGITLVIWHLSWGLALGVLEQRRLF